MSSPAKGKNEYWSPLSAGSGFFPENIALPSRRCRWVHVRYGFISERTIIASDAKLSALESCGEWMPSPMRPCRFAVHHSRIVEHTKSSILTGASTISGKGRSMARPNVERIIESGSVKNSLELEKHWKQILASRASVTVLRESFVCVRHACHN